MLWGSVRKVLWKRGSLRKICYELSTWNPLRKNASGKSSEKSKNKKTLNLKKNSKKSKKQKNSRKPKKNKKNKKNKKKQGIWEKWPPKPFPETLVFFVFFVFFGFLDVFVFFFSRLFWLLGFYRKFRRFFLTEGFLFEKTHWCCAFVSI